MIILLAVNMVWAFLMFALSFHLATQNALSFYPATLPIMFQAITAAVLALAGGFFGNRKTRYRLLAASSITLGTLFVPWGVASVCWPGGDDGGGLGWFVIMGSGCAFSMIIAMGTFVIGLSIVALPPKRQAGPAR